MREKNKAIIQYLIIYGILAFLWVFSSDQLIYQISRNELHLTMLQTIKGWLFILVTLSYMYFGVKRVDFIYKKEQESLSELAELYIVSNEFIVVTDENFKVLKANPAFLSFFEKSIKEIEGEILFHNISMVPDKGFNFTHDNSIKKNWRDEVEYIGGCGKKYILNMNFNKISSPRGKRYLFIFDDISISKNTEKELSFLANHDELTELPNRKLIQEKFEEYTKNNTRVALVYFDLDGFKEINDLKGHMVGDKLLKQVSETLQNTIDENDIIARMGGDEFLILMENVKDKEQVIKKLKHIQKTISITNNQQEETDYKIGASMGVCLYPDDGLSIDAVLSRADLALNHAKTKAKGSFLFYDQAMSKELEDKTFILNELKKAFESNEFFLEYQPKINILKNQVEGVEALIRWKNKGKLIQPDKFIHIAEESGYASDIFDMVFNLTIKNLTDYGLLGNKGGIKKASINVSPKQFSNKESINRMKKTIEFNKEYAKYIILEVTESCIMENIEHTIDALSEFKKLGFEISIDDFGTGYSSLSNLRNLPISELKIDRMFVKDLPNHEDEMMVRTINDLATGLKLSVVAEGVETEQQLNTLNMLGCHIVQGFYFSKPLSIEKLKQYIEKRKKMFEKEH